jgi:hypothetical protein
MGNLPMSLLRPSNGKYARYKLDAIYESQDAMLTVPRKHDGFLQNSEDMFQS